MGRWLTPDPLGFADGPNLYAYVHNNPYKYFDPDGLTAWEFTKGAAHSLGYTAAAGMAFRGATAGLSMLCPPLGASLTAGYMAYSAGSFLYRNWDSIKHVGSEFMNKGFSSGMNEIGRGFNRKIEEFNQLSDYDKGSSLLSSISIFKPRGKAPRYKPAPKKPVINKVSRVAKNTGLIEQKAVKINPLKDLDKLSNAGKVLDRGGLTKAGRALDKHGNRPNSVFPKARGNISSKNAQGQFHLDDILTYPGVMTKPNKFGGLNYYAPDGRGVSYFPDGTLRGFLQP